MKTLQNIFIILFSLTSFSFFSGLGGCDQAPSAKDTAHTDEGGSVDVTPPNPNTNPPPSNGGSGSGGQMTGHNVILMIGSGMGPQQVGQVVQYRRLRKPNDEKLALEKLMDKKTMGLMATSSYLDIVSDTAAANTAMACGLKVRNHTIGIDANGNPCANIFERAFGLGKATGIVSNVSLSNPSVASYLAHQLDSDNEEEIAYRIFGRPLDEAENADRLLFDVLLSGGMEYLIPQNKRGASLPIRDFSPQDFNPNLEPSFPTHEPKGLPSQGSPMKMSDLTECAGIAGELDGSGERRDQTNLIEEAKTKGYQFVCKRDQLNSVTPSDQTRLLGVFSHADFPRITDRKNLNELPSLSEMTSKALEVLEKKPKGFLLVVNDGLTQNAAAENDPGTLLQEGLDFDSAVQVALDYVERNPDTLLIVTADHETGGFGFSVSNQPGNRFTLSNGQDYEAPYNYAPFINYDLLMNQQKSFYLITQEILTQLYAAQPSLDLESAASQLVTEVSNDTPYQLSQQQARQVLQRPAGSNNARTQDFPAFFVNNNIHSNLLSRAIANQTSTVWSSGTSTSTPVLALATGPTAYAEQVRGFIDNTEIAKIVVDALAGR